MAEQARPSRALVVPRLQHATLAAMGISVPWIASDEGVRPVQAERPQQPMAPQTVQAPSQVVLVQAVAGEKLNPDLQAMDLGALSTEIGQCQACGLCQTRKHAVAGEGVARPALMVIGEAPGEQEDLQGRPFVGRSGQLLDNMLAAIDCSRSTNVYITNVVKCRPPANRNPREEEIHACSGYLQRQIDLVQPRAILAMGLFAAQTLLQARSSLNVMRQKVHSRQTSGGDVPVIVTYHPAYLLRRPVDKRLAWQDLKSVASLIGT